MASIHDLVNAYLKRQVTLPALFASFEKRGPVAPDEYARDKVSIEQLRDEEHLDAQVARALLAKLASMQPAVDDAADASADDDAATQVQPVSRPTPASGPEQDDSGQDKSTGTNASTWHRVANAAGGESAYVGMLLKGRFKLEREIGRGGMGVVYLARDERKVEARDRNPLVAVKVLNDEFRRHPDALIALQREARRSQQLAHDNIVRVYDFDKDGTIVFMTMEYVDGTNLKDLIREHANQGVPMARARPLIEGMAEALKRAHKQGVIHSDFKPGNVMVTKAGMAKVFDFGIARAGKQPDAPDDEKTVFDAGTLGALTPAYASLNMLRGADPTPADDIYALGCVIYELLTGKHPFDKLSAEVANREGRKAPLAPGLTKRQSQTLQKAVAFEHKKRLQSVDQLQEGLRALGWRERIGRPLLYAVVVIVILVAAGWGVRHHLHVQHMNRVVAGFQAHSHVRYANAAQAIAALQGLDPSDRKQLVTAHGSLIQQYFIDRVNAYWDPGKGRHDYASAQRVFKQVHKLGLFLPLVDARQIEVKRQQHALTRPKPAVPKTAHGTVAKQSPASQSTTTPAASTQIASATAASTLTPSRQTASAKTPAAEAPASQESPKQAKPVPQVATRQAPPSQNAADQAQEAKAKLAAEQARKRMRAVTTALLREGKHNFARQEYSSAIANAKAALRVDPGNADAKRLLQRAEQAQQKAMSSITIH